MNGIDEFLEVTAAMFLAITAMLMWLTYLEASLLPSPDRAPRRHSWIRRRFRTGRDCSAPKNPTGPKFVEQA